jgi:Spy/CpxP family protein refolding chaperone
MNRRQMVILPGIALAASQGFSQSQQTAATPATGSGGLSHKAVAHYSRLKSFYTIPKSEAKQVKYISFLTTLLSLTPNQQTAAANIFATASTSHATVKKSMKAARQSLGEAVKNNDSAGINQNSAAIGTLAGQRHSIGASANAAFFQILSGDQQAKFNQFRS